MAGKKKVINGFSLYLREQKDVYSKQGYSMSMEEAVKILQPRYKGLPASEKEVYEARAKREKEMQKNDPTRIFDAYGVSLADRAAEVQRETRERNQMVSDMKKTIKEKRDVGELESHFFYIGHFNYLVVTDEKEYIPCEVAIARYSLAGGIQSVYHCMIQPGQVPNGYAYSAKDHSERTHQIPSDGIPDISDASYSGQIIRMNNFLKNGTDTMAPIYFLQQDMEPAKAMIEYLFGKAGEYRLPKYKVYDLNKLFQELMRDTSKNFPVEEHADAELKSDRFDYQDGIACKFHDPLDNPKFCSRHCVYRWAYIISDYCSEAYNIQIKPGHHYPKPVLMNPDMCGWSEDEAEEEEEEEEEEPPRPSNVYKPKPTDMIASDIRYNNNVGRNGASFSNYGQEAPLPEFRDPEENDGWSVAGAGKNQPAPRMVVRKPTSQGSITARMSQSQNWSQNSTSQPWGQSLSASQQSVAPPGFGRSQPSQMFNVPPTVGRGRGMDIPGLSQDMIDMSLGGRGRGRGFQ